MTGGGGGLVTAAPGSTSKDCYTLYYIITRSWCPLMEKKTSTASGALNLQKFDLRQLALITVLIVALMFLKGLPLSNLH